MDAAPYSGSSRFVDSLPRRVFWSTGLFLAAGFIAFLVWWRTGDPFWIRFFFAYPGALFFLASAALQSWLSYRCWMFFSPGDLLRPAWFLILLASLTELLGGVASHLLGLQPPWNPLSHWAPQFSESLAPRALAVGRLASPVAMLFLVGGLWHVVRACQRNGILGKIRVSDLVLPGIALTYTAHYFTTVVFSPDHGGEPVTLTRLIGWASDPLLCILLIEATVLRRSAQRVGWGLISKCWVSFTAAIFLTSVGDFSLWASSAGYLPLGLQGASWYVWFLASACFVLGPAYQLTALTRAIGAEAEEPVAHAATRDFA